MNKKLIAGGAAILLSAIALTLVLRVNSETVKPDLAMAGLPLVTVHKSPSCGCCQKWVDYLQEEGFSVKVLDHQNMNPIKVKLGIDQNLQSCHTATVGNYVIEGHVPANDIKTLLAEKPEIVGLTAPGMPMDSPGMNSREPKGYAVLSFTESGETEVYSQY